MASDSVIQAPSDGGDVASQIPFHDLCALMEKIHKTQGTDKKKKKILSSFIERWRETHARLHHTDAATTVRTTGQTWMGTGRTRKYLSVMIYIISLVRVGEEAKGLRVSEGLEGGRCGREGEGGSREGRGGGRMKCWGVRVRTG